MADDTPPPAPRKSPAERYDMLTGMIIPLLWGYPLFCAIMRIIRTEKSRTPKRADGRQSPLSTTPADLA